MEMAMNLQGNVRFGAVRVNPDESDVVQNVAERLKKGIESDPKLGPKIQDWEKQGVDLWIRTEHLGGPRGHCGVVELTYPTLERDGYVIASGKRQAGQQEIGVGYSGFCSRNYQDAVEGGYFTRFMEIASEIGEQSAQTIAKPTLAEKAYSLLPSFLKAAD